MSQTEYTYTDLASGYDWKFDGDYFVEATHSDGTFDLTTYEGGRVIGQIGRDGSETTRTYDALGYIVTESVTMSGGRNAASDTLTPITLTHRNLYDALGRVVASQRQTGTNTWVDVSTTTRLSTGEVIAQRQPETGILTTSFTWRDGERLISEAKTYDGSTLKQYNRTRAYPDGTPLVSSRSLTVSGTPATATTPVPVARYDYSVSGGYLLTTEYRFAPGDTTSESTAETATPPEWSKTFSSYGRTVKVSRPDAADALYSFNSAGQLTSAGNGEAARLYEYDSTSGEISREGTDLDGNGNIESSTWDRIARYERSFVDSSMNGFALRRSEVFALTTSFESDEVLVSRSDSGHRGADSWASSLSAGGVSTTRRYLSETAPTRIRSQSPPGLTGNLAAFANYITGQYHSGGSATFNLFYNNQQAGYFNGYVEIAADVFSEDGEVHAYNYEDIALATGLPVIRRLASEVITGRTSEAITVNRQYGDGSTGHPTGVTAGYTAEVGEVEQLEVAYTWGVNGRLSQLDTHFPDSYADGNPRSRTGASTGITGMPTETSPATAPSPPAIRAAACSPTAPPINA